MKSGNTGIMVMPMALSPWYLHISEIVWHGMGSHGWLVAFSCETNGKTIQYHGLDAKKHGMP